jgi:peptide/nickel transport system permease protein
MDGTIQQQQLAIPAPRRVSVRLPWKRIWKEKAALVGAAFILLMVICAIGAEWIAPFTIDESTRGNLASPTWTHLFGTDELGRDVFSRMVYSTRVSLPVGVISTLVAVAIGVPLGLVGGYFGRWTETFVMRALDAVMAFPGILLALMVAFVLGHEERNLMLAIGIIFAPSFARLVHGSTLTIRERDYVTAARVLGANNSRIITRHVLPNILSPVIVQISLTLGWAILIEASLSYIGLGVSPPTPSWGSMIRNGYQFFTLQPWGVIGPGLAVTLTVLALNMIGDGFRNVLDPRQHGD